VRSFQFYEQFKRRGLGSVSLSVSLRAVPQMPERLELRISGDAEIAPDDSNRVTLSESTVDLHGDPVAHLHFSQTERDRRTQEAMRALIVGLYRQFRASDVEELPPRWGHHHLGTVRMGRDARRSVVSPDLQLHGVSNAYVLSSGNFVTSGPANPTLLIVAFAHRLAAHLIERMREGAFVERARQAS
jgi:choline dehydrogenase-like flavoprotein